MFGFVELDIALAIAGGPALAVHGLVTGNAVDDRCRTRDARLLRHV